MKKPSLQDKVVKYIFDQYPQKHTKELGWVSKGEILRREWRYEDGRRYISSTVDRALRLAEEAKRIAVRYEGKNTLYKWIPHDRRAGYIPTDLREDKKILFKSI